jgi:HNH endonuclease
MSSFSEATKQRVRQRAGNRCEYCQSHQDYLMGWLQIDHFLPVSKGGSNEDENLCLACELCNQYKWNQTEAIDPESQNIVGLFNPRRQVWHEHFDWSDDGVSIVGLTPYGRSTVVALKLNNSLALKVRGHWVSAGWHPPS